VSFPPNNPRLIASLKKTFADLATPLDLSIRNVWRGGTIHLTENGAR